MESQAKGLYLEDVSKYYSDNKVLDDINIHLDQGKFYTLLGPSGCGKTTILNLIAGFTKPTRGRIYMDGEDITDLATNKRKVNTVFQNYSLFPHMDVYENVAFGLKIKKLDKKTIDEEVKKALAMVQLEGFEKRKVQEMSGGQKQRVSIARAIVNKPSYLLLDEPLSALDMKLRKSMQVELRNLQQTLGITFIFVTHDQEEALAMSDWIFLLNQGRVVQSGPPKDIYDEPINRYVAEFVGESNILPGKMKDDYLVEVYGRDLVCSDAGIAREEQVEVVIRPEDLELVGKDQGQIKARVETSLYRGVFNQVLAIDDQGFEWKIHTTKKIEEGTVLGLKIDPEDMHVMRFNESEEDFDARIEKYSGGNLSE